MHALVRGSWLVKNISHSHCYFSHHHFHFKMFNFSLHITLGLCRKAAVENFLLKNNSGDTQI